MVLYHGNGNGNVNWANASPIPGTSPAHSQLSKQLRAIQAAEAVAGMRVLYKPTGPRAATLWGVSQAYVRLAGQILENEKLLDPVNHGRLALIDAAGRAHQLALPPPKPAEISDDEIDAVIAAAGVERTFDRISAAIS
jgi:hypothetical protein